MSKTHAALIALLLAGAATPTLAQAPGATPPLELPPVDGTTPPDPLGADAPPATTAPTTTPAEDAPETRTTTTTQRTTTDASGQGSGGGDEAAAIDDAGAAADEDRAARETTSDDDGFDDWGLLGLLGLAGLLGLRRRDERYVGTSTVHTTDTGVGGGGLR